MRSWVSRMADALRMLSLARKAGKAEVGEEPVMAAVDSRKARLVLLAADAAENTKDRFEHILSRTHIAFTCTPYTRDELGAAFGRASCAVCAVCDLGLSEAVAGGLEALDREKYGPCAEALRATSERIEQRKQKKPGVKTGRRPK